MRGEDASDEIDYVHNFYMNRKRKPYAIDCFLSTQKYIDDNWTDRNKNYRYAIWGLTQISELTADYISEHYPNARLNHVYDRRTGLAFRGHIAEPPERIADNPDDFIFVTALGACKSAKKFFDELRRPSDSYNLIQLEGIN